MRQLQPGKLGLGTNKYFLDLQNQLADLFMLDDIFSGDAASEVLIQGTDDQISGSIGDAGDGGAPTLPDADSGGGGSIEMQELNVDKVSTTGELSNAPELPGSIEMQELGGGLDSSNPSLIASETEYGGAGATPGPGDRPKVITPGDDAYDPIAFDDGSPVMLDDIPSSEPFSWDMVDPTVNPEFAKSLAAALSEENALTLGRGGIGTLGLGAVGNFMKNRATDLLVGQFLGPLFGFIDSATDTPWVSRSIQGVLSLFGLVGGGDPFGMIASPISWGIMEYMKQRLRLVDNKDPEAERGKKFGYVREGDKWYPAIQVSKERDEGWMGSNKTQVNFQYGKEIKWKKGKAGQGWIPYFEKGQYRSKNFHVWDSEVDDPNAEGGEEYQKRVDPLRDFFYLTEEQTHEYLMNIAGGDTVSAVSEADQTDHTFTDEEQKAIQAAQAKSFTFFGSNVHDDVSWSDWWAENGKNDTEKEWYADRGAYVNQMQDIRKSLEFMHGYRFSDEGTVEAAQGTDEFEGSREFRTQLNDHDYLGLASWLSDQTSCQPMMGCYVSGTNTKALSGRLSGKTDDEVWRSGLSNFQDSAEMTWLTDEYHRQIDLLYKTQKEAGKSKGFDKLYTKPTIEEQGDRQFYWWDNLGPNAGWSLYQDGTWGFGHLDTAAQLRAAIEKIEASGHSDHIGTSDYRNADQRSYLAQKAYCRYMFSKINQLGGYDYTFSTGETGLTSFEKIMYRDNDEARYNGENLSKWSLDPMYSALDDDGDDGDLQYGVDELHHRDDYDESKNKGEYWNQFTQAGRIKSLRDAGIWSRDDRDNPDYIAGNFKTQQDFDKARGVVDLPWDNFAKKYVLPGTETPGSVYNPETDEYDIPWDWVDPNALPAYTAEDTDIAGDFGFTDWSSGGFGGAPTPGIDFPDDFYYDAYNGTLTAPDGKIFEYPYDADAAWVHSDFLHDSVDQQKAIDDAEAAKKEAEAAAKKAAEDAEEDTKKAAEDAVETQTKVVPDQHHGATHVHDEPYELTVHDIQHHAPDETVPAHIPLALIHHQVAEGVHTVKTV